MMALSDRPSRKAKRTDVDYAVLSSGQQIPEYSDENDDSDDENYGSNYKKKRRKQGAECFICHRPPRTYRNTMLQCDNCSRLYHAACGKPFQSASILGNTSCYECLQEAKVDLLSALPRKTLDSITDFIQLLKKAKKIVVIAGAGISVSCGIPDFRSKDGIYAMARNMDVVLPEPECLFQIDYFRDDPAPFFEVVRNAFASSPKPSPTHWFLRLLQDKKKLLRVYTQNIDGLEEAAGVTRCIPCHGSFAYSACMRCKKRIPTNSLMSVIQAGIVPTCSQANCRGVLKPEITFFGEILDDKVSTMITKDRLRADLLIVIGTSLKVAPVMEIPSYLPSHIPQVVINKTALKKKKLKSKNLSAGGTMSQISGTQDSKMDEDNEEEFDMSLLGNCDDIVRYICAQAGWDLDQYGLESAQKTDLLNDNQVLSHQQSTGKRVYCFGECQCKNRLAAGMDDDDDGEDQQGGEEEDEGLEEDIVCNRCEQQIDTEADPGSRCKTIHYRCNECFDYDLCGDCYPKRRYTHKGGKHRFSQCL
ncbi:putative Zinc finger, ZZ-type, Zinc finger, PHD-type, Sirtuin family, Zinc finger, FYVE/PHD-type [Plasmopara halstedii]